MARFATLGLIPLCVSAKFPLRVQPKLFIPPRGTSSGDVQIKFSRQANHVQDETGFAGDFSERYILIPRGGSQAEEARAHSGDDQHKNNNNNTNKNEQTSDRLFGTRPGKGPQRPMSLKKNAQNRLRQLGTSAKALLKDEKGDKKDWLLSTLGPSLFAVWSNRGGGADGHILSFGTLYALSLLGSSVGFHSFLYFISVGYALGITLPMMAALAVYRTERQAMKFAPMTWSTFLHSILVVVWGVRALTFFLWREYVNWPALHRQIQQVNDNSSPAISVKLLIWVMYSFLYTAMLSPCWFRLQRSAMMTNMAYTTRRFTPFRWLYTCLPIIVQLTGLTLESVADYQKSMFKLDNRYEWCHVGLWTWSTHPNYLGEMLFWTGTYLGWILFDASSAAPISKFASFRQFVFTTIGYIFITTVLRGSIRSMSRQHMQKYGHLPEYDKFRQTHGLIGPKLRFTEKSMPVEEQSMQSESAEDQQTEGTTVPASSQ